MSEDVSPDPSIIKPPQEDEATHIEVTSHEGDTPLGEVALSDVASSDEQVDTSQDGGVGNHPREGEGDYVKNKDKAEVMAHAQNDFIDKRENAVWPKYNSYYDWPSSKWEAEKAGRDYEIDLVAKRYSITPEQAQEQIRTDTATALEYGHAIVENHRKFSDKIGFSLELTEAIYDFSKAHPSALEGDSKFHRKTEDGKYVEGVDVSIGNVDGALKLKITDKQAERVRELSTGIFEGVSYKITEFSRDGVGFDVQTIKTKQLDGVGMQPWDQERYLTDLKEELQRIKEYVEPKRAAYDEDLDDEDDRVSMSEIQQRARAHFGNTEHASDMARDFPGDFIT